jgi:hypothetical protein
VIRESPQNGSITISGKIAFCLMSVFNIPEYIFSEVPKQILKASLDTIQSLGAFWSECLVKTKSNIQNLGRKM